MGKHEHEPRKL